MKLGLLMSVVALVPVAASAQDNCAFLGPDCRGGGSGGAGYLFLAAYAVGFAVWIYHMRWRALPWIAAFFGTVVIIANVFSYPYVIATMFALMAWALGYWLGSGWLWDKEDESS